MLRPAFDPSSSFVAAPHFLDKIRDIWHWLITALAKVFVKIRCYVARYEQLSFRKCRFHGPPAFLAASSEAMAFLSCVDPLLYEALTCRRYVFWYEPKGGAFFEWLCGIPRSYLEWKKYGILACVLFTHFKTQTIHDKRTQRVSTSDVLGANRLVYSSVRSWLEMHGSPTELVRCFCDQVLKEPNQGSNEGAA